MRSQDHQDGGKPDQANHLYRLIAWVPDVVATLVWLRVPEGYRSAGHMVGGHHVSCLTEVIYQAGQNTKDVSMRTPPTSREHTSLRVIQAGLRRNQECARTKLRSRGSDVYSCTSCSASHTTPTFLSILCRLQGLFNSEGKDHLRSRTPQNYK